VQRFPKAETGDRDLKASGGPFPQTEVPGRLRRLILAGDLNLNAAKSGPAEKAFHNHKPCDTAESILTTFNKIPVDKKYFAL
jgi:hypothetical protein